MKNYLPYILILIIIITLTKTNRAEAVFCTTPGVPSGCTAPPVCNDSNNPTNKPCIPVEPYKFLTPLPDPYNPGTLQKTFDSTQTNSLGSYLNLMIRLFIGICAVLAVIMIVIGGMQYMTSELMESKADGKRRIEGAIFGLLLALAAYAILYTINPDILKVDLQSLKQVTIAVGVDTPQTYDPITKKYANGATYGNPWDDTVAPLAVLPPGVTAKGPECTFIGQTGCTSTRGLLTTSARLVQQGCQCSILITGGTESWLHESGTSHQTGSATVDLRADNQKLNDYLSSGQPLVNRKRYPPMNAMYETEGGPHWHVGP